MVESPVRLIVRGPVRSDEFLQRAPAFTVAAEGSALADFSLSYWITFSGTMMGDTFTLTFSEIDLDWIPTIQLSFERNDALCRSLELDLGSSAVNEAVTLRDEDSPLKDQLAAAVRDRLSVNSADGLIIELAGDIFAATLLRLAKEIRDRLFAAARAVPDFKYRITELSTYDLLEFSQQLRSEVSGWLDGLALEARA